jgi:hypothetical protein
MRLLMVVIKKYFKFIIIHYKIMYNNFLVIHNFIILYFFGMQDDWFSFRTIVCRLICFIEIFLISLPHTTIIDW